ncbi:MAG TPA: hypothetical protein VF041_20410 [Gemmatimonadaceae bacterium]
MTPPRRGRALAWHAAAGTLLLACASGAAAQRIDSAATLAALHDYRAACAADGGRTWGRSLCGPVALVDRATRVVIASDSVAGRAFLPYAGAFITTLPADILLANTSFTWEGRQWAMVMLPLPGDRFARTALLVHESFHREQDSLGLVGGDPPNPQLDEMEGRRWFRLELRALAAALDSLPTSERGARRCAADALLFRARRHALYPGADSLESALEIREGLAEYTGERLAMALTGEGPSRVARAVRAYQAYPSYVRSFEYATGPALGLLLDRFAPDWRSEVRQSSGPAHLLATALRWRPPSPTVLARLAERRAAFYGGAEVAREEATRDSVRRAQLADYRARLLDGPSIVLRQSTLSRSFNPSELVSFDSASTVYPTGTFTAPWGSLVVTRGGGGGGGGALVSNDFSWLRVQAPATPPADARTIEGPGWTLTLAPGWSLRAVPSRPGTFEVVGERGS